MPITVWHLRVEDPEIREAHRRLQFDEDGDKPVFPRDYDEVAVVDTEDIDAAFQRTQHIDHPWFGNEGVTVLKESHSTSMGDVVVDVAGHPWLCARIGWERITLDTDRYLAQRCYSDSQREQIQEFAAKLPGLPETVFFEACRQHIWLSAYASSNAHSAYHPMADLCYDEAKRRGQPELYTKAYEKARSQA